MSKPLLPFGWLPGHWGLKGKTRERAKIDYELTGYDRERAHLKLDYTGDTMLRMLAHLDHSYGKIDTYELEKRIAGLDFSGTDLELALLAIDRDHGFLTCEAYDYMAVELTYGKSDETAAEANAALVELDYKYGKIGQHEYEREIATANKEPYVAIIDTDFDINRPERGAFEFDWNEYFIKELRSKGYGKDTSSEEEVVEAWFKAVCYGVAMEDELFDVAGQTGMTVNQTPLGDGRTEFK